MGCKTATFGGQSRPEQQKAGYYYSLQIMNSYQAPLLCCMGMGNPEVDTMLKVVLNSLLTDQFVENAFWEEFRFFLHKTDDVSDVTIYPG